MNKLSRVVDTENAVNNLRHEIGHGLSFQLTVGDKDYDLPDRLDSLPRFDQHPGNQLGQLFQFEQTLHNKFNKILKDTGWTPE